MTYKASGARHTNAHPSANIFPLMTGPEFQELCNSIRENGQREPIKRRDGQIIDGRNRFRACQLIGIEPLFETNEMDDQAVMEFIIDENLHRRHLDATQRAVVGVKFLEYERGLAAARKLNGQRSGGRGRKKTIGENSAEVSGKATARAAKKVGVDEKYVREAAKLAEDPEALSAMQSGKKTLQQVKREKVEEKRAAQRAADAKRIDEAPSLRDVVGNATFPTIVVDPPWDYSDEGAPGDVYGRGLPTYQTLSMEQRLELTTVGEVPILKLAANDSHLYLWVTNRSKRKGYRLLDEWGFRHVTCLTWCKPSFGMGNYFRGSTEHLLFGVRGSLPLKRKDVGTWFMAKGGERSAKPDEAFRLIESCSTGPYLEIFARRNRPGWSCWGAGLAAMRQESSEAG